MSMTPMLAGHAPFTGRLRELDLARQSLERARAGFGGVLIVGGEAGLGKAPLAAEAAALAEGWGLLVARGQCSEQERLLPYAPFLDLLRTSLVGRPTGEVAALLGPAASELVKLSPELAWLLDGVLPTAGLDPPE